MLVIGGGVGGCSAAYHLAKCGAPDILVLERASLGAGTTWHSTGNMETYRDDPLILDMVRYGLDVSTARVGERTASRLEERRAGDVHRSRVAIRHHAHAP